VAPSRARMHEILAQLFRALHRFALGLARPIIIIIRQQSAEILENWDHIQRHTLSHEHVLTGLACLIQSEALSFTISSTPAHCCAGMGGVYGRPRNKHIAMDTSRMGKRPLIQYDECVTNMSVHEMSAEIGSASCLAWAPFDRTIDPRYRLRKRHLVFHGFPKRLHRLQPTRRRSSVLHPSMVR
jgi:hypothetical protein